MSLFSIQRYTGEENDGLTEKKLESQHRKTLKAIRKKAKLKKREQDEQNKTAEEDSTNIMETSGPDDSSKDVDNDPQVTVTEGADPHKEDSDSEPVIEEPQEETKTVEITKGIQQIGSFTVLGEHEWEKTEKVTRRLPDWLLHPKIIEDVTHAEKKSLEDYKWINPKLLTNLKEMGVEALFPVQEAVIPAILRDTVFGCGPCVYPPNDLCVSAPTGSGKTLAFALPIVQALIDRVMPVTRALVVLPTKELAAQIHGCFTALCKKTHLHCALLTGQKGSIKPEQKVLLKYEPTGKVSSADIVIATPGRLIDHLNETEDFSLEYLRFLVIDEADRMVEQVKQQWLTLVEENVYKHPTRKRLVLSIRGMRTSNNIPLQKLLFSATLSADPEKLEQLNLFEPRLFTAKTKTSSHQSEEMVERGFIGKYTTPVGLTEHMIVCTAGEKPLVVLHLSLSLNRVLCFTGSIETAKRLTVLIQLYVKTAGEPKDFTCAEFSSHLTPAKRQKVLKDFKNGKVNILVCSDSMARGMDIKGVSHVILYDAPPLIKTYIHRIGRTARAGEKGSSYTLLRGNEVFHFKKMLKESGKHGIVRTRITPKDLELLTPTYETILPLVADEIRNKHY